ncbi:hypothetical protein [Pseudomonas sp. Au-Pse12]|uniref:hypothetical protein n=1 Tax=Pseudomonas sp. Au-Pse12 TaxID=2906459 RepID=UPI001E295153|nr:hypothetical protein [Pseudomonas sp. Au-Pse12]MCE4054699.1 hypothetical protein [Pseudomonas sp. Au-Pse12]
MSDTKRFVEPDARDIGKGTFTADGLLSPDQTQVCPSASSASTCTIDQHASNIVLTRKAACQAQIDRYDSVEEIRQGVSQLSALYRKDGCEDPR